MEHADAARRLGVRANADTPEDAARARRFGAQGIGLCRTEHMFLGERRQLVENLILAERRGEQEKALAELLPLQREDFAGILEAMDGLPVTIRLIDPPLHEFLPDFTDLSVEVALARRARATPTASEHMLLEAVQRLHEQNPMLGLRGVRLGIVIPGLFAMQARAILEAAAAAAQGRRRPAAGDHDPAGRHRAGARAGPRGHRARSPREVEDEHRRRDPHFKVGTMIELPRAALTAGRDRRRRGVLLLRHQRPDPDDLGLLPRRRRGVVLLAPTSRRASSRSRRSSRSTPRASARWCGTPSSRAARPVPTCTSASAASTAATRTRSTSSTRSGSTTCPARRSGCRSPGSRPAASAPGVARDTGLTAARRQQELERVELVDRDDPDARAAGAVNASTSYSRSMSSRPRRRRAA